MEPFAHYSVMAAEVLQYLAPRSGGVYLDGTLGGGGHSELILEASGPDGLVYGIDRDPAALAAAGRRLERFGNRFRPLRGAFGDLAALLSGHGVTAIDGLVLDLGVSSPQLDHAERGFSFRADGPLDMRMDPTYGETAADLVNRLSERELEQAIKEYGEERWARKIAQRIVVARQDRPFETTRQLAELVERTIPRRFQEDRIHPATRTFQGLRILVNNELEQLEQGLQAAIDLIRPGGRLVVISFHSLEDRIVKQRLRDAASGCRCPRQLPQCVCGQRPLLRVLTSRPVMAGGAELAENPRSRSAKLRAAERLVD